MEGDAAANLKRWQQGLGELHVVTSQAEWHPARAALAGADLIVDALLGTGLRGPVEGLLGDVIQDVNAVADESTARAENSSRRRGHAFRACFRYAGFWRAGGRAPISPSRLLHPNWASWSCLAPRVAESLWSARIGTPPELLESDPHLKIHWIEPGEFRALPLARDPAANKGTYGHALLVAGSLGKSGAAVLAARGALRSGAGLATAATPDIVLPVVAAGMPEMMTVPLAATEAGTASYRNFDYGRFSEITRGKSVIAIGPGLSTHNETQQFIRALVAETDLPIILDADGLNAFAGMADHLNQRRAPPWRLLRTPAKWRVCSELL